MEKSEKEGDSIDEIIRSLSDNSDDAQAQPLQTGNVQANFVPGTDCSEQLNFQNKETESSEVEEHDFIACSMVPDSPKQESYLNDGSAPANCKCSMPMFVSGSSKSSHTTATNKTSQSRFTFRRSPSSGRKARGSSDSMRKSGKQYLSDEDGIGNNEFYNFKGEEDERNYSSETELDVPWNQSDSVEADQYKMDPEADQMKGQETVNLDRLLLEDESHHYGEVSSGAESERINVDRSYYEMNHETAEDEKDWMNLQHDSSDALLSFSSTNNSSICGIFSPVGTQPQETLMTSLSGRTFQNIKKDGVHDKSTASSITPSTVVGNLEGDPSVPSDGKLSNQFDNILTIAQSLISGTEHSSVDTTSHKRLPEDRMEKEKVLLRSISFSPLSGNPDTSEIEHKLHSLLMLSDKHLPERSCFDENSPADKEMKKQFSLSSNTSQNTCKYHGNTNLLTNMKGSLPLSYKYLLEDNLSLKKTCYKETEMHIDAFDLKDPFDGKLIPSNLLDDNFHLRPCGGNSTDVANLLADNKVLQTTLEEQQYRRKHCEKQILFLQKRTMELQQTVAVAVSLDRKKDDMISEVDRMLAKVMERWKKKEEEENELMQQLVAENKSMRDIMRKQEDTLLKYENQIQEITEKMKADKEKNDLAHRESNEKVHCLQECIGQLEVQRSEEVTLLKKKFEDECSAKVRIEREFEQKISKIETTYEKDKNKWKIQETNFKKEIQTNKQASSEILALEKMKIEKQQSVTEDLHLSLQQLQDESDRHQLDLDELNHEKDSLKTTLIMMEGSHNKEVKELQDRLSLKAKNEVAELTHRLVELHKWEMEDLVKTHNEEVEIVEKDYKKKHVELVMRLSQAVEETMRLKQENEVIRNYKQSLSSKIQVMLQSQCQAALRMLDDETTDELEGSFSSFASWKAIERKPLREEELSSKAFPPDSEWADTSNMIKEPSLPAFLNNSEPFTSEDDDNDDSSPVTVYQSAIPSLPQLHQESGSLTFKDQGLMPSNRSPVGVKQNQRHKITRHPHDPGSSKHFSSHHSSNQHVSSHPALPHTHFNDVKVPHTPPTRLVIQPKEPPTNDKKMHKGSAKLQEKSTEKINVERSNTLKRYIKMMLQQSPGTLLMEDGNIEQNNKEKRQASGSK